MKLAICMYGITRSLNYTAQSIHQNVIRAASQFGEVSIFGHFYDLKHVENRRSGENHSMGSGYYDHIPFDNLVIDQPDNDVVMEIVRRASTYGDAWSDDYKSLKNLVHQLHAIRKAFEAAEASKPDGILFIRPDLSYHDSLTSALQQCRQIMGNNAAFVPAWQTYGGLNDRFLIAASLETARAVAHRIDLIDNFCSARFTPLHSEKLLRYALKRAGVKIYRHTLQASRVRSNGAFVTEHFHLDRKTRIGIRKEQFLFKLKSKLGLLG